MLVKPIGIKLKFTVIVVITFILLELLTSYVFGFLAQKQLVKQFNQISQSGLIQVKNFHYKRGLFSSEEFADISLNSNLLSNVIKILPNTKGKVLDAADMTKLSIKYHMHIEHGLFAGFLNGYFAPTIAYSRVDLTYPDSVAKILKSFFAASTPLSVENILYINNSGYYKITSPSFNYAEALSGVKVNWGGLLAKYNYNSNFDVFTTHIAIPQFSINAPQMINASLQNLDYNSTKHLSINQLNVGDVSLKLSSLMVNLQDKIDINFKLGDIIYLLTGISSTEFLNNIDAINPTQFTLNNIYYSSNSNDDGKYFGADAKLGFSNLITEGSSSGPFTMQLSLNHILAKPFSQLINNLGKNWPISSNSSSNNIDGTEAMSPQMLKSLKESFTPILVDKPVINLNQFTYVLHNGEVMNVNGKLTTSDFIASDMNNPDDFMRHLIFDVSFKLPKQVISYLFILQMKYLLTAGNAQMDAKSTEALSKVVNILVNNQINTWTKHGYVSVAGDLLQGHLLYSNGELQVTGQRDGK